jgi:hypothetical protein
MPSRHDPLVGRHRIMARSSARAPLHVVTLVITIPGVGCAQPTLDHEQATRLFSE